MNNLATNICRKWQGNVKKVRARRFRSLRALFKIITEIFFLRLQEILVKCNVVQSLLPAHSVKENAIMGYLEKKIILRTVFKNSRSLKLWKTKVEKKISVFKISGYYVDGALVNEDFFLTVPKKSN